MAFLTNPVEGGVFAGPYAAHMLALITGPVRSGKSAYAERIAAELGGPVAYVATARIDPADQEMADRVARHRADRDPAIRVIEVWGPDAPDLPALLETAPAGTVLIVDSLGTWLAGHLLDLEGLVDRDPVAALATLEAATDPLIPRLREAQAHVIVVAEETGWGLVPMTPLGRIFRDHLGRLTAAVAAVAGRAELVVAGYALDLKAGRPVR